VLARWVERARLWLTFGEENRARLLLGYAQTRLREAGLLAERGDLERLGRVVAEHARLTQAAHEQLERAQRRGREVAELVDEVQHSLVQAGEMLARVRERVATRLGEGGAEPPGLERARQALVAAEKTVAEVFGRVEDVRARVPRPGTGR
jgi:DNA repair exonuclease SbcCD ATPase subunit